MGRPATGLSSSSASVLAKPAPRYESGRFVLSTFARVKFSAFAPTDLRALRRDFAASRRQAFGRYGATSPAWCTLVSRADSLHLAYADSHRRGLFEQHRHADALHVVSDQEHAFWQIEAACPHRLELHVEEVPTVDFAINLKTAAKLGIKVPEEMIIRADEVYR